MVFNLVTNVQILEKSKMENVLQNSASTILVLIAKLINMDYSNALGVTWIAHSKLK
jgi:hypothetical protein